MIELAPGLSYWLAPHPSWEEGDNWPQHVPSFRFESPDGLVFVDPLAPPDEAPDWILLTSPWHARDTARIVERHPHVRVWAPPLAHWQGASLQTTDEIPAGVVPLLPDGDPNEALFFFREQRALVTGDLFSATGGRFHLFLDDQDRGQLLAWLPRLLALPLDLVLVAHGDFVLADARAELHEAIGEATVDLLLDEAHADDDVLGVYVFGSRGRPDGLRDVHSDWDVGVVLPDAGAVERFDARWPFVHGAPVEIARATLAELRTLGDYGSESEWSRPLYAHVDLLLDKSGEIAPILEAKRGVPDEVRERLVRDALDAYVNSTYRALRYRMVGAEDGARLDAAESLPPLLTFLFALDGRVRPFNKHLAAELAERPVAVESLQQRLAAVLDGDAGEQHALFRDVERIAREHGYGDVIDGWEPDVAWLRGDAPYRTAQ